MMAHRAEFSVGGVTSDLAAADLRVTVDTPEDLAVVRAVVDALGARASRADELVAYLRSRPDIVALNAHVEQKPETSG